MFTVNASNPIFSARWVCGYNTLLASSWHIHVVLEELYGYRAWGRKGMTPLSSPFHISWSSASNPHTHVGNHHPYFIYCHHPLQFAHDNLSHFGGFCQLMFCSSTTCFAVMFVLWMYPIQKGRHTSGVQQTRSRPRSRSCKKALPDFLPTIGNSLMCG